MPDMASEGRTTSLRAGGKPVGRGAQGLASGSRRWARKFSSSGRRSAAAVAGPPPQLGPDPAGEPDVVLGPEPVRAGARDRDPGRDAPGADDHAPVLAVGVGRVRPERLDIDPGDQCGIGGQGGLDLVQPGDLARQRAVIPDERGLELAQGDARDLALAAQVLEPLRPLGLVETLGTASTRRSSWSSLVVNSRRRACWAGVSRWSRRAASSSSRPRPRSSSSACHASAG